MVTDLAVHHRGWRADIARVRFCGVSQPNRTIAGPREARCLGRDVMEVERRRYFRRTHQHAQIVLVIGWTLMGVAVERRPNGVVVVM